MANTKLTELTATTTVAGTDLAYLVLDPSGTPVSRKITVTNLVDGILQGAWGTQGAYGAKSYATGSAISITKPVSHFGARYTLTGNTYTDGATIAEDDIELVNCKFAGPLTITGDNVRIVDCTFANLPSGENAISITGADNVQLRGIHLSSLAESGIVISGSTNVQVIGVTGGNISTDYSASGLNATTNPEGDAAVIRIISLSSNIQIANVQMTTCDADGIDVADSTDVELTNCKFGTIGHANNQSRNFDTENRAAFRLWDSQRVTIDGGGCDFSYGHGVFVRETSTGVNLDIKILNASFRDCLAIDTGTGNYTGVGISGRGCIGMVVSGNSIEGCGRGGIQFTNEMANPIITGNLLYGNGISSPGTHGDAIDTANTRHAVIANNVCKDSYRNGITIKHVGSGSGNEYDVTCIGNVSIGNGSDGIHCEDASGTAFNMSRINLVGNIVTDNDSYGITLDEQRYGNVMANTGGNNKSGTMILSSCEGINIVGLAAHGGANMTLNSQMIDIGDSSTRIHMGDIHLKKVDPVSGTTVANLKYGIRVADSTSSITLRNYRTDGMTQARLSLNDAGNLIGQQVATVVGYASTNRELDTADT